MSHRRTSFTTIPLSLADANAYVAAHHRRHGAVRGHKFSLGAARDGVLVGVVIIGRPNARALQDGRTVEITRLCTAGERNACSFLYGAATRAAAALGYRRIGTYIAKAESGASLRAVGWRVVWEVAARSWDTPSRRRSDAHAIEPRLRLEPRPIGGENPPKGPAQTIVPRETILLNH